MKELMLHQGTLKFWQSANFGSRVSLAPASMFTWIWGAICCTYEVADWEAFSLYLSFVLRGLELQTVALLCKSSLLFFLLPVIAWGVISETWLLLAAHGPGAEGSAKYLAVWVSWLFQKMGGFFLDDTLVLLSSCMPSFCFRAGIRRAAVVYPVFFWVRSDSASGKCA